METRDPGRPAATPARATRLRRFLPHAGLVVASASLALGAAELALRTWAPVSLVTIGHPFNANAARYGWGYDPHETVVLADPDTGTRIVDRTNAAGWRDREHAPGRVPGVFRVLVLGDSVTFGPIVSLDDLYTRVLERTLQQRGYAVEVVSIALGQWGTDQELEALRLEGLSYGPDLVVLEYTGNDPADIAEPLESGTKPFRYELGPTGALVRHANPYFAARHRDELRDLAWQRLRDRFEILKRGTLLLQRVRGNPRPAVAPAPGPGQEASYVVTDWGTKMLTREFGVPADDHLLRWLRRQRGAPVAERKLRRRLGASAAAPRLEEALRMFENRWFADAWTARFEDIHQADDLPSYGLLLALFDEVLATTRRAGASLAVLSTQEAGHYEWDRYWFHVGAGPELRARYLASNEPLRDWGRSRRVDFLVPHQPIVRARNDPHPNREGNRVMAQTLADYIETRFGSAIARRPAVVSR